MYNTDVDALGNNPPLPLTGHQLGASPTTSRNKKKTKTAEPLAESNSDAVMPTLPRYYCSTTPERASDANVTGPI